MIKSFGYHVAVAKPTQAEDGHNCQAWESAKHDGNIY